VSRAYPLSFFYRNHLTHIGAASVNDELQEWLKVTFGCIHSLQSDFSENRGLILTEGDLECLLFSKLNNHQLFARFEETKTERWKSGYIHSQVTWFRPGKDSGFRVDLTILNPTNLRIEKLEIVEEYPNKGFFHDGTAIAIETKFIRDRTTKKVSNDAKKDYMKIVKNLKVAKEQLISDRRYSNVTEADIAYIDLIGCKTKEVFDIALEKLTNAMTKEECPPNVFPIIFCHQEITSLNSAFIYTLPAKAT
jgi:hypothetical protein